MEPVLIHSQIDRDGQAFTAETAVYECGLRVLTLATTSADLLLQVVGTYTSDDRLPEALVSEAIELPDADAPALRTRNFPVPPGFATLYRDVALADHLAMFCEVAARTHGGSFQVISRPKLDEALVPA